MQAGTRISAFMQALAHGDDPAHAGGIAGEFMRGLVCVLLFSFASASAQAPEPIPRGVDGRPDFHGLWTAEFLTPMERPKELKTLVIAPEDAEEAIKTLTPDFGEVYDPELDVYFSKRLMQVNGEMRSSLVVEPANGELPITALTRAIYDMKPPRFDNPEERPAAERCVTGLTQAPLGAAGVTIPYALVQTSDAFLIAAEDMNPYRVVDLTGRVQPPALLSRTGHSSGRWEGDVLVVETTHFVASDPRGLIFGQAPVSEASRVIERFSLLSPDALLYEFTIEDRALYSAPWRAEMVLERYDGPFWEYACHEGNSSMASILLAARMGRQEDEDDDKDGDEPDEKDNDTGGQ